MPARLPARPAPTKITRTVLSLVVEHATTRVDELGATVPVPPVWSLELKHQVAAADGTPAGWTDPDTAADLTGAERTALKAAVKTIIQRHVAALSVTADAN
jgi:hypothetical protein